MEYDIRWNMSRRMCTGILLFEMGLVSNRKFYDELEKKIRFSVVVIHRCIARLLAIGMELIRRRVNRLVRRAFAARNGDC